MNRSGKREKIVGVALLVTIVGACALEPVEVAATEKESDLVSGCDGCTVAPSFGLDSVSGLPGTCACKRGTCGALMKMIVDSQATMTNQCLTAYGQLCTEVVPVILPVFCPLNGNHWTTIANECAGETTVLQEMHCVAQWIRHFMPVDGDGDPNNDEYVCRNYAECMEAYTQLHRNGGTSCQETTDTAVWCEANGRPMGHNFNKYTSGGLDIYVDAYNDIEMVCLKGTL